MLGGKIIVTRKSALLLLAVVGYAARYHIREMERIYRAGFDEGWKHGKKFARGEYDDLLDEEVPQNSQNESDSSESQSTASNSSVPG